MSVECAYFRHLTTGETFAAEYEPGAELVVLAGPLAPSALEQSPIVHCTASGDHPAGVRLAELERISPAWTLVAFRHGSGPLPSTGQPAKVIQLLWVAEDWSASIIESRWPDLPRAGARAL